MNKALSFIQRLLRRPFGKNPATVDPSPLNPRAARGQAGEDAAATYLTNEKGMHLLARNWRSGRDELDIVARDGPTLVFVEVRSRHSSALVDGYHSITRRKKKIIRRACLSYLAQLPKPPKTIRFDVVSIEHEGQNILEIRHFSHVPLFAKFDPRKRS